MTGATITLSNFGSIGDMHASLVSPPPTVAVVGIGRARDLVVARQGSIAVRRPFPVSLTFNHLAITGGETSRFLNHLSTICKIRLSITYNITLYGKEHEQSI